MNQLEAELLADPNGVGVRNATPVRDGWLVTLRDGRSCFVPDQIPPPPANEILTYPIPKFGSGDCEKLNPPPTVDPHHLYTTPTEPAPAPTMTPEEVEKPVRRSTMFSLPPWDPSEMSPDVSERVRALRTFTKCDCVLELCSFEVIEGGATNCYQVMPYVPVVVDYVIISRSVLIDDFTIGNIRPLFASQAKGLPSELFDYLTFERQIVPEARPDLAGMDPRAQYPQWWGNNVIQNVVYPGIVISATIRNPSPVAKRVSALVLGRLIEA